MRFIVNATYYHGINAGAMQLNFVRATELIIWLARSPVTWRGGREGWTQLFENYAGDVTF